MPNTTVYFSISNAANQPLTGSQTSRYQPNYVTLAPTSFPLNNNESILDADVITYTPDSNGVFTASLYPQIYKGYIKGTNTHTHFLINVPTGSSAVNAADILVVTSGSVVNTGKYAYSCAVSDIRYLLAGASGSLLSSSYATTASYALNGGNNNGSTVSASWASSSISASYVPNLYPVTTVASASWASQSLSASFASNAYAVAPVFYNSENNNYYGLSIIGNNGSEVIQVNSVTYNSQSGVFSNVSSSYATTASYALNGGNNNGSTVSASWASSSISASYVPNLYPVTSVASSSWSSASFSSSYALNSSTASYITSSNVYGTVSSSISSSWASSSISSSYALNSSTASYITASKVIGVVNNSIYAQTASYTNIADSASFLKLWDSGLSSWVTITSYNGSLTIIS